ncbi:MAG: calcineurin-like phosphoesterase C-terminal domain-containing protein, partial [Candidatus Binatia bacterium]
HTTGHHYFGAADGLMASTPHHHHAVTAVSVSRCGGPLDRRGIASADSRDGTPRGFHVLSINHGGCTMNFILANEPNWRQMRISLDAEFHFGRDLFRDFRAGQLRGSPI